MTLAGSDEVLTLFKDCDALTLLLAADTVARTAFAPAEVPVEIITAVAGGPFFLYLLRARRGA